MSNLPTSENQRRASTAIFSALFAVILFSLTVPMTQMALSQFSPMLIATGRGAIAGALALGVVILNRWSLPAVKAWPWLIITGMGIVVGFPYLIGVSMEHVPAADMGVVLAGLPLITALMATLIHQERHPLTFWGFALAGCTLLIFYMIHTLGQLPELQPQTLGVIIAALIFGGLGYSAGAKAAKLIGGWQTICWTLALYSPVTIPLFITQLHQNASTLSFNATAIYPVLALLYLAIFSQFLGFRFWYQALATGGVGKISQLQLLQPFFSLAFISMMFQQAIGLDQILFCLLIVACVLASMKPGLFKALISKTVISRAAKSKTTVSVPNGTKLNTPRVDAIH
ncbi:Uncharacterised protein [BD1-7 clade bacterium]|uniref:EamA domain-containing protein n=1 Tax=BD1-7 clade bacterium TaxID=2029982 RepID=A0A5S9Q0I2_9GAMM|nr:Uncharacterised protein [BD1-7 clade bacterium]CAA0112775.1 Uncharacterised protein [BD1-7 clade bacterium]